MTVRKLIIIRFSREKELYLAKLLPRKRISSEFTEKWF